MSQEEIDKLVIQNYRSHIVNILISAFKEAANKRNIVIPIEIENKIHDALVERHILL